MVDPDDLAPRIVEGTRAIWPDMQVEVSIEGCRYQRVREQMMMQHGPTSDKTVLDLRDVNFDPATMFKDGQLMGDGEGNEWVTYNIVFPWREEALAKDRPLRQQLRQDHDAIWTEPEYSFWSFLFPPDYEQYEIDASGKSEALFQRVLAGEYGDFSVRNHASGWYSDMTRIVFNFDTLDEDEYEGFSLLGWSLNNDVADGIVADMTTYAQTHCASPH